MLIALKTLNPDLGTDKDHVQWKNIRKEVIAYACEAIEMKGNTGLTTSWATGLSVADLAQDILTQSILRPIQFLPIVDLYGINEEVFLSVPCTMGENSITELIKVKLNPDKESHLEKKKCRNTWEIQKELKL
ncbi:hypothetical protein J1605_001490 [Eschrichtius robustus]|uniref:Lactate/malate dehydrogenase C-terminal domain-containing protein n=1 Tax=Eschrichtius robustus TaxID=9764 RepID=A0AB34I5Y9_ESCRO|nr:hypothetical protein J1605_001490 [Eschrichtius robustus]